ncbi:MAG: hypothetical protein OEO83_02225 [Alphaproteobacteria bacterium]|nr:hypothetical protein [Alphaproteobacteria bacterium]
MSVSRMTGLCWAVALAAFAFCMPEAQAQSSGFYKGKTLTLIVGYPAGSAYVTYAQLAQRHIARFLPGKPKVTIKFMPGAGSLIAANYLADVAPKDGTTIATLGRGTAVEPLFRGDKSRAKFDPRKLVWLGSLNSEVSLLVAWHNTGIETFDDTLNKTLLVAIGSVHGDAGVFARTVNSIMGTKFKIICCFHGSAAQNLAMERGEVGARMNYSWSALKRQHGDWLKDKKVQLLAQFAANKHPELANVPLVADLVKDPEDRKILDIVLARQAMGRPYAAPPGIGAARAKTLRTAFDRMVKDADFLADAGKRRIEINDPLSGEKVNALLERVYKVSDATKAKLRAALETKGRDDLLMKYKRKKKKKKKKQ